MTFITFHIILAMEQFPVVEINNLYTNYFLSEKTYYVSTWRSQIHSYEVAVGIFIGQSRPDRIFNTRGAGGPIWHMGHQNGELDVSQET